MNFGAEGNTICHNTSKSDTGCKIKTNGNQMWQARERHSWDMRHVRYFPSCVRTEKM
jgi:hypothetical protein